MKRRKRVWQTGEVVSSNDKTQKKLTPKQVGWYVKGYYHDIERGYHTDEWVSFGPGPAGYLSKAIGLYRTTDIGQKMVDVFNKAQEYEDYLNKSGKPKWRFKVRQGRNARHYQYQVLDVERAGGELGADLLDI